MVEGPKIGLIEQVLNGQYYAQKQGEIKLKDMDENAFKAIARSIHYEFKDPAEIFRKIIELSKKEMAPQERVTLMENASKLIAEMVKADLNEVVFKNLNAILTENANELNANDPIVQLFDELTTPTEQDSADEIELKNRLRENITQACESVRQIAATPEQKQPKAGEAQVNIGKFIDDKLTQRRPVLRTSTKNAKIVAQDLKLAGMQALASLPHQEFYKGEWGKINQDDYPNLMRITADFNNLARMAEQDILSAGSKKQQVRVYNFYQQVALECIKIGDYNSARAISGALNGASINRLDYLANNIKGKSRRKKLEAALDAKELVNAMRNHEGAIVPFNGNTLTQLDRLEQNPEYIKVDGQKVFDVENLILAGNELMALRQQEAHAYLQQNTSVMQTDIHQRMAASGLEDGVAYDRSLQYKTRDGKPFQAEIPALDVLLETNLNTVMGNANATLARVQELVNDYDAETAKTRHQELRGSLLHLEKLAQSPAGKNNEALNELIEQVKQAKEDVLALYQSKREDAKKQNEVNAVPAQPAAAADPQSFINILNNNPDVLKTTKLQTVLNNAFSAPVASPQVTTNTNGALEFSTTDPSYAKAIKATLEKKGLPYEVSQDQKTFTIQAQDINSQPQQLLDQLARSIQQEHRRAVMKEVKPLRKVVQAAPLQAAPPVQAAPPPVQAAMSPREQWEALQKNWEQHKLPGFEQKMDALTNELLSADKNHKESKDESESKKQAPNVVAVKQDDKGPRRGGLHFQAPQTAGAATGPTLKQGVSSPPQNPENQPAAQPAQKKHGL